MEFLFILIVCPIVVFHVTKLIAARFSNGLVAPALTFVVLTVLAFIVFNATFFFWVIVFTIFSAIISFFCTRKNERAPQ